MFNFRWRPMFFLMAIPILGIVLSSSFIFGRLAVEDGAAQLKVDLSARQMTVIEGGETVRTYSIAVGRASNPTPTGNFRTGRIVWNPGWNPPDSDWAKGEIPRKPGDPKNPMRGVKIYFKAPAYFIHGTNDPGSIGQAASRGCIRMREADAKSLANWIESQGGGVSMIIQS